MAAVAIQATTARAQDDLPGRVGRVADVAGEMFLAPQDQPEQWAPIGLNYPVTSGDNLWVGNQGRAEVDFGGGQFRMAGNSSVHVSRLDDRQFALFVAQGGVQVRVRVLDPGETARIDTPNAQVVLLRPGSYRIDVSEDRGQSQVVVREGEANVLTLASVQQVLPGQTASVDGADPQFATVRNGYRNDDFDLWAGSRDRRYDRGRSANYVSPQMVGAAELDEYGTWAQVPEYGAVWYPSAVAPDWAPYRNGYWAEVGAWGPTWVDAAPWGYAPFHYGRWAYVGGRWGWCPGAYVARPLWAPALVGWAGGPGWGLSVSLGAPVYGWVPLGWGEPFRPWWNRCSHGCWDRYNRPYNVNTATVRPNSPPPSRYVNWNAPGGISAVRGASLTDRRPVQGNLVDVPRGIASSAPVLAGAPMVRSEPGRIPTRRVGDGTPPPASTFYPTLSRPATAPGGVGTLPRSTPSAAMPGAPLTRSATPSPSSVTPAAPGMALPRSGTPPPTSTAPLVRQAPSTVAPSSGASGGGTTSAPPTRPLAQQGITPSPTAVPGATPTMRSDSRAAPRPGMAAPTPAQPQQAYVPPPSSGTQRSSTRSQPSPVPMSVAPTPMPSAPIVRSAPAPQPAAPMVRSTPAPQPTAPMVRSTPVPAAPVVVAPPPQQSAPAPAPPARDSGGNMRRDDRGSNPDSMGRGMPR
jgi:hypothetical protein